MTKQEASIKEVLKGMTAEEHRQLLFTVYKHYGDSMAEAEFPADRSPENKSAKMAFMFERWEKHVEEYFSENK